MAASKLPELEKILGNGGYGIVWRERKITDSSDSRPDMKRAVKVLHYTGEEPAASFFRNELEALAKFSSRKYKNCFVTAFGWYEVPGSLSIPMEYCPKGDLRRHIAKYGPLPESQTQDIASQIAQGIKFMHDEKFAHRDLKPGNILIKSHPPDDDWWVKICDMGLSKRIEEGAGASSTMKGTAGFFPPEKLGFNGNPRRLDDYAVDIWCLGETIFQILTGQPTFPSYGDLHKYQAGSLQFPVNKLYGVGVSETGVDFILKVMAARPAELLKAGEANEHPWIQMESMNKLLDQDDKLNFDAPLYWDADTSEVEELADATAPWSTTEEDDRRSQCSSTNSSSQDIPEPLSRGLEHRIHSLTKPVVSYEPAASFSPNQNSNFDLESSQRRPGGTDASWFAIVSIIKLSERAAFQCARQIHWYLLGRMAFSEPWWQYNAVSLLRTLVIRRVPQFLQWLNREFSNGVSFAGVQNFSMRRMTVELFNTLQREIVQGSRDAYSIPRLGERFTRAVGSSSKSIRTEPHSGVVNKVKLS
ncbi:kinase-like domain-containing protein [Camillea tinctor]|nr:kinase-like domain-containing protein [Camillea tinctor]